VVGKRKSAKGARAEMPLGQKMTRKAIPED